MDSNDHPHEISTFDAVAFMRAVMNEKPRRMLDKPLERPCNRAWRSDDPIPPGAAARVVARHPSLVEYEDTPILQRSLYKPRSGWGRLQRASSRVAARMLLVESSLEFDVFRNVELDPSVTGIVEQPLRIRYRVGDVWRRYTPDFLVMRADRRQLVEVKYEEVAAKLDAKWEAIAAAVATLGFDFSVITERHVRSAPRQRNVDEIYRRRHVPFNVALADEVVVFLEEAGPQQADSVARRFDLELNQVWAMVRHLHLGIDLDTAPIGGSTIVTARRTSRPWRAAAWS